MAAPKLASVGHWVSPITSKLLTAHTKRLGGVSLAPDGWLHWLELRPTEKGRQVLVSRCGRAGGGAGRAASAPVSMQPR